MNYDNTQVVIDLDAIEKNIAAVKEKTGLPVMGIIKADAYGHGAIQVARLLQDKCAFFGVSSMLEAMELRRAGLETPILILGYTPVTAFPNAIRYGIRPSIFHYEDALALSQAAVDLGVTQAPFHFALDTGMSRIGFQATAAAADQCARIANLPGLHAEGLFTHFATADSADLTYGLYPSDEVDPSVLSLTPALSWRCRITHLKLLEAGREISYGGTYTTTRPTRVATIPVGYADGYRRSLSNRFYVLIHGKKAPILGRVCMDQLMVDVTDIPETKLEDTVVLVGRSGQEEISMEQIAAAADSFNYEFVCGISRRVPRIYVSGGKIVNEVRYLLDT